MERKVFLKSLGAGAAFALAFPCLHGCSKDADGNVAPEDMKPIPTGVDFTIDLNSTDAALLANNGGFILVKSNVSPKYTDIVVARNLEGVLVAASQICSHQQTEEVRFVAEDGGFFRCSTHGSKFDQSGAPLNTITSNPLKVFNTELNGDILRVFE